MHAEFAFGKNGLTVDLPEGFAYRHLEARSAQPLENPAAELEQALDSPVSGPPLAELARGARTAAISVCDITRPAPNRFTLPPMLKRLHDAGIARQDVTILIATGLHRPATDREIQEILGEDIASHYRVVNHNARNLEEHRFLGHTTAGTPVYVDERFVAADLHLTLGFIEPHLMAGFSGGRKLVTPGLAAQQTIKVLHSPKFMREPKAVEGSIEDNPLHRELLEIAGMAGHHFLIDVALTRDRKVAAIFAGEPREAHAAGVRFVSGVMLERLEEPADLVITTAAGYPLDLTFYQAVKGVTAASHIVRPGGRILLMAACEEGPGAEEFRQMLRDHRDAERFLSHLEDKAVEVDQWQLEKLALVTRKADLYFYVPGLEASYYPSLWGQAFPTPNEAVAAAFTGLPATAKVAVIPEGPYVLAKAGGAGLPASSVSSV